MRKSGLPPELFEGYWDLKVIEEAEKRTTVVVPKTIAES